MDVDDDNDDVKIIGIVPPLCEASLSDDDENDDIQFLGEFNYATKTLPRTSPSSSSAAAYSQSELEVPVEPKLSPYSDIDDDEQDQHEAAAAENRASQQEALLRKFQQMLNSAEDVPNSTFVRDSNRNQTPLSVLPRVIGQNAFNEIAMTITSMISRIDIDIQELGKLPPRSSGIPVEFVELINKLRQNCGRLVLLVLESINYKTVNELGGSKENLVSGSTVVAPEPGPTRDSDMIVKYVELLMTLDEYLQKKDYKLGWNIFEVIKFRILRILKCSFLPGSSVEFDECLFVNVSASLAGNMKKYSRKIRAASINKICKVSDQIRGVLGCTDKINANLDHRNVNPAGFEGQIEIVRSAVILLSKA